MLYDGDEIVEVEAIDSIGFEEYSFGPEYLNDNDRRRLKNADKHIAPSLLLAPQCPIVMTKNISQYMMQVNGT